MSCVRTPIFAVCVSGESSGGCDRVKVFELWLTHQGLSCREFADYVSIVADPKHARVVAVTSPERAAAAQKERPDFFDEVTKIL